MQRQDFPRRNGLVVAFFAPVRGGPLLVICLFWRAVVPLPDVFGFWWVSGKLVVMNCLGGLLCADITNNIISVSLLVHRISELRLFVREVLPSVLFVFNSSHSYSGMVVVWVSTTGEKCERGCQVDRKAQSCWVGSRVRERAEPSWALSVRLDPRAVCRRSNLWKMPENGGEYMFCRRGVGGCSVLLIGRCQNSDLSWLGLVSELVHGSPCSWGRHAYGIQIRRPEDT